MKSLRQSCSRTVVTFVIASTLEIIHKQIILVRLQDLLKDQLGEEINDIDIIGPLSMSTDRPEIRKLMDELGAYDEDMVISSDHSL